MTRRRLLHAVCIVVGLVLAQGAFVLVYRWIDADRKSEQASFRYERVHNAQALDLVLLRPDGSTRALANLRGKPVLLHFWATWCPPCKAELPGLLEPGRGLAREKRLQLVALSIDKDWNAIRKFFGGQIPPEVVRDGGGSAPDRYEVSGLPDTYLLDGSGERRLRFGGAREWRTELARRTLLNEIERFGPTNVSDYQRRLPGEPR